MHTFEMFTLDKDISMQISAIEHFDGLSEFNVPNIEKGLCRVLALLRTYSGSVQNVKKFPRWKA